MASDGGVQAKLDSAKAALASAEKFSGPTKPVSAAPSYKQVHTERKAPTLGDELAVKKSNVEDYAKQYGNQ